MELSIFKNKGVNSVDTREIHRIMNIKTKHKDWVQRAFSSLRFIEGKHYIRVSKNLLLKSEQQDWGGSNELIFIVPLRIAYHLAVTSKTDEAFKLREHLFDIEERYQLLSKSKQKKLKAKLAKSKAKLAELEVETYILQGESNEAGWYLRKQARDMFMRVSEQMTVQESVDMSRRIRRLVNLPKEKGWNRATVDQTNKRYKLLKEYL